MRVFEEVELWLAIIRVVVVVAMILFSGWPLLSGDGSP